MSLQSIFVVNTAPGCDNFIEQQVSATTCNSYIVRITQNTNALGPFDVYVSTYPDPLSAATLYYSAQTRTQMLNGVVVQLGPCVTPTPTLTPTPTPSSATPTPTQTPTETPTQTQTPTQTTTETPTQTQTPTQTTTETPTQTPTQTTTETPTQTPTQTTTETPTPTTTETPTNTPSPSPTPPIFAIAIFTQDGQPLVSQNDEQLITQEDNSFSFLVTSGDSSGDIACTGTTTLTVYTISQNWPDSVAVFTDSSLSTPLNGASNWYSDGCYSLQINNSGQVIGFYSCGC